MENWFCSLSRSSPDKSFVALGKDSPSIDKSPNSGNKQNATFTIESTLIKDKKSPNHSPQKKQISPGKEGEIPSPGSPGKLRKKKINESPRKLKVAEIESALNDLKLLSPTTSMMLNSVIMRAGEKGVEQYSLSMKKKRKNPNMLTLGKAAESTS